MRGLLAALGRQARWALPAGVLVGIVLPGLAAQARGRSDRCRDRHADRRAAAPGLGRARGDPAPPGAAGSGGRLAAARLAGRRVGPDRLLGLDDTLRRVLLLQAAAPPIGSAAVFALILGVDGLLAMVGAVAATLLLPLTLTPLVAVLLSATGVQVDLGAFAARRDRWSPRRSRSPRCCAPWSVASDWSGTTTCSAA